MNYIEITFRPIHSCNNFYTQNQLDEQINQHIKSSSFVKTQGRFLSHQYAVPSAAEIPEIKNGKDKRRNYCKTTETAKKLIKRK